MTRRLQTCRRCGGKTRHADRRCSRCRHLGVVYLVRDIADIYAPTMAELAAAIPIGHMVDRIGHLVDRVEITSRRGRGA